MVSEILLTSAYDCRRDGHHFVDIKLNTFPELGYDILTGTCEFCRHREKVTMGKDAHLSLGELIK